jgi:hypothetical protein
MTLVIRIRSRTALHMPHDLEPDRNSFLAVFIYPPSRARLVLLFRNAYREHYCSGQHVPFQWAAKETNGLHGRSGILEARMTTALPFMRNVLQRIESAFDS